MSRFQELQGAHLELLGRYEQDREAAELLADVQAYAERVQRASREIGDSRERNQLRANLRFWGAFLYERTGTYPNLELLPADESVSLSTVPGPSPAFWERRASRILVAVIGVLCLLLAIVAGLPRTLLASLPIRSTSGAQHTFAPLETQQAATIAWGALHTLAPLYTQQAAIGQTLVAAFTQQGTATLSGPALSTLESAATQNGAAILTQIAMLDTGQQATAAAAATRTAQTGMTALPPATEVAALPPTPTPPPLLTATPYGTPPPTALVPTTGGGPPVAVSYSAGSDCSVRSLSVQLEALPEGDVAIAELSAGGSGEIVEQQEISEAQQPVTMTLADPLSNQAYLLQVKTPALNYDPVILQFLSNCERNLTTVAFLGAPAQVRYGSGKTNTDLVLDTWGGSYDNQSWIARLRIRSGQTGVFWVRVGFAPQEPAQLVEGSFYVEGANCEPARFVIIETTGGFYFENYYELYSPYSFSSCQP